MKKLRLLLLEECDRSCKGCCNEDWDLASLPICTDYSPYDEIILTGGEPMLHPEMVEELILDNLIGGIRANVYMYTAKTDDIWKLASILNLIDGITVTLHDQKDVEDFEELDTFLWSHQSYYLNRKSFRLNIFKGVKLNSLPSPLWKIKDNIEWIKDSPLPQDETFMRLTPAPRLWGE